MADPLAQRGSLSVVPTPKREAGDPEGGVILRRGTRGGTLLTVADLRWLVTVGGPSVIQQLGGIPSPAQRAAQRAAKVAPTDAGGPPAEAQGTLPGDMSDVAG